MFLSCSQVESNFLLSYRLNYDQIIIVIMCHKTRLELFILKLKNRTETEIMMRLLTFLKKQLLKVEKKLFKSLLV